MVELGLFLGLLLHSCLPEKRVLVFRAQFSFASGPLSPDPCPLSFTHQFLLEGHHRGGLASHRVKLPVTPSQPGQAV